MSFWIIVGAPTNATAYYSKRSIKAEIRFSYICPPHDLIMKVAKINDYVFFSLYFLEIKKIQKDQKFGQTEFEKRQKVIKDRNGRKIKKVENLQNVKRSKKMLIPKSKMKRGQKCPKKMGKISRRL